MVDVSVRWDSDLGAAETPFERAHDRRHRKRDRHESKQLMRGHEGRIDREREG